MKQSILLILGFLFAIQAFAQRDLFTPVELKADLQMYQQVLDEVHPDAFKWYPRDSFVYWISHVESQLTRSMSSMDFRKLLMPIHQKVGCGHSRFSNPLALVKAEKKRYKKGAARNFLPFDGKVIGKQFFTLKDFTKSKALPKGTEILAINGMTMSLLLDSLSLPITSDGYNTTHFLRAVGRKFPGLYRLIFGEQDHYSIKYRDSIGAIKEADFAPRLVTKAGLKAKAKEAKKTPPIRDTTWVKTKQTIFKKKKYSFSQSLQDSSVYILRIPSFMGSKGKRFHKKAIKYLNGLPSQATLVIDIRNNGGGDFVETATLTSMLVDKPIHFEFYQPTHLKKEMYKLLTNSRFSRSRHRFFLGLRADEKTKTDISSIKMSFDPHKKINFAGPLYVFIDGYSFSASSVLSSFLRDQNRAIFIGEETGGGMHGTNAMSMPSFKLPNSGLRIRMPMWKLVQVVKGQNLGHGIYPDVTTQWTIEDVIDRRDVDMETMLEWKKKMYKKFKDSKN